MTSKTLLSMNESLLIDRLSIFIVYMHEEARPK